MSLLYLRCSLSDKKYPNAIQCIKTVNVSNVQKLEILPQSYHSQLYLGPTYDFYFAYYKLAV